jgi:hypothetical protein
MRRLVPALTALALAACSEEGEAPAEPASAPAVAAAPAGTREAAYAAAREGPEPFVRALFARHAEGAPQEPPPPPGRDPLLGRTLNAAVGAVGGLEVDPTCGCAPGQAVALTSVAVVPSDANTASAEVAFSVAGQPRTRTLSLVREGPSWRLADARAPGERPLLETLLARIS